MNESKKILEELNEAEILIEMANLYRTKTKLPVNVWIDEIGNNRKNKHYLPRIKVQNDYQDRASSDTFSLLIDKNKPEILAGNSKLKASDLNIIKKWVKNNYDILMKHWQGEIDTDDLKQILYK